MGRLVRSAVVLLTLCVAPAETAGAAVESPFVARFSANEPGAVWVTGSTLMTCPAVDVNCASSQAGTASGAALSNNGFSMVFADVDADPATFNSSSSTFAPPVGTEVLFAGLYFGGRVTAGAGGAPAPNAAARGNALLRTPTSLDYLPVTAAVANSAIIGGAYVAFADVTALVRAAGAGRYGVANVQSGTGADRFAGWALVVVYRDTALPLRSLTVFDGLAAIQQGDPALSIGVTGFKTPLAGPVRTSVGIVAYEGDRGSAGDRLALNGQLLSDAANPATNVFNSSVSFEGTNTIAQRLPAFVNGLGFDSDRIVADGLLGNGVSSATLEASTTLDQYLIQVATFTTDLSSPRLELDKAVTDLDGGDVDPGDVLRYTVTARNTGDDAAVATTVQDPVPAGTTLTGGSPARAVELALGTLAAGASASASFDVVVDAAAPDGFVVANAATATGTGATAGRPVSAVSPTVTAVVRRPAIDATLVLSPDPPTAGEPVTAAVTVVNRRSEPLENVVVTLDVPDAAVLSAPAECTVGDAITCRLGTLAPGKPVTLRLRLRPSDSGTVHPAITVSATGVPARSVTVPSVRVRAGRAQLTVRKQARSAVARPGGTVTYRITVSAARSAATARSVRLCDEPGPGLRLVGTRRCWRFSALDPGQRRVVTVRARVTATGGAVRNVAQVRAANGSTRAHAARLRVAPRTASACGARTRLC